MLILDYIFATTTRVVPVMTCLREQRDDARELVAQLQTQVKELQQINRSLLTQMNELIDLLIEVEVDEEKKDEKEIAMSQLSYNHTFHTNIKQTKIESRDITSSKRFFNEKSFEKKFFEEKFFDDEVNDEVTE